MSKKPQQVSKDNPKYKQPTLDEENEPFLRVIHKKIRNLNKRLTQIAELQHKENLKPEQIEKVQRKQHIIQERQKMEDNIAFYKEAYTENAELFRAQQLRELELLARTLAVFMTHPQFPEHVKLARLWSSIQTIEASNLNQAITHITNLLKQSSNDYKLQKALSSLVAQHGEKPAVKKVPTTFTHTDQIIIVKENVVNEKGQMDEIEIVEKIHDGKLQELAIFVNDQIKREEPATPPPTPAVAEPQTKQTQPQTQQNGKTQPAKQPENGPLTGEEKLSQSRKSNIPKYRGELRERKDNRRGTGRHRHNEGERGEKKTYRPKQDNTRPEQERQGQRQSDEEARNFKREQIKKLEDEGFTVVGKPKPKPQQQQQQQQRRRNYRNQQNIQK